MQGTDSKSINQFCSVCKSDFDMEIIKQGSNENVLWLKCPGCKGFLPYMPDEDTEAKSSDADDGEAVAIEDLDIENAKEYAENDVYEVGEIIHHRSWNDYGRIVSKDLLPGNRHTIVVQFLRQGKVQLLENVAS
ncbi:MAG: hypothetical protein PVF33_03765 [Candidatus Latescibacterota bacterium]